MKAKYLFIVFLFISCSVFSQTTEKPLYERIYLQTDKDVYLTGELIWLKLMTSASDGTPLDFSKIGYIELLDGETAQAQLKVVMSHGIGSGNLVIPSTLPTGYYRLVAYTRYMRNESPVVVFEKVIGIVNPLIKEKTPTSTQKSPENVSTAKLSENTILIENRNNYSPRSLVDLNLGKLPDNIHSLSISVAAKDLTSDLPAGNIIEWQQAIKNRQNTTLSDKFLVEYEGHIVTGKLVDNNTGKMPPYDDMLLPYISFPGKEIKLFGGKLENDGTILFFTKDIGGTHEAVSSITSNLVAVDGYRVDIESPFILNHEKKLFPPLDLNRNKEKVLQRSMALQVLYSYLGDSLNRSEPAKQWFRYLPNKTYVMEEYTKFATMQEVITEFITSVRFRTLYGKRYMSIFRLDIGYSNGTTLVLLDGIPIFDHEIIFKYNPLNISKIDVFYGRYVFGGKWYDGIIDFTTHNYNYPDLKPDVSTRFFNYAGTQLPRIFYSPTYKTEADRQSRLPDFRSTLYWNPDVKTDNKDSVTIPFYTSDYKGSYQVVVEGVTKDGKPIYATSSFNVE